MQRVVNKGMKTADGPYNNTASSSMADSIKKGKARYSEKLEPEERQKKKLALANLDSSSSDDLEMGGQNGKQESDAPTDNQEKAERNPKAGKKRKRNRGKDAAQEAHTKMCERAMDVMDKISNILHKFDSDSE